MLKVGTVVRSLAGRDKASLLVITGEKDGAVLVCDGKERPLSRPKCKNIRHIEETPFTLTAEDMRGDRALRQALGRIAEIRR